MKENSDEIGYLRLPQVLELIPISKSNWWSLVANNIAPQPVKLTPRTTAWKKSDIYKFISKIDRLNSKK